MIAFKRILLFCVINLLVVVTVSALLNVALRVFGVDVIGGGYMGLFILCFLWGMIGAFISLALSRIVVKWMTGVSLVDIDTTDPREQSLYRMVEQLAQKAGLPGTPEVGIYPSSEINAFATGPTRARSLVAVSEGLLDRFGQEELEGVLGHEIAHIANGDMVTMTLVQGVINAFVMFVARILADIVCEAVPSHFRFMVYFVVTITLEILLSVFGMIAVAWYSRRREYRADEGGAQLAGHEAMLAALTALQDPTAREVGHEAYATMKISGKGGGIMALFSTHPPLEKRIARLRERG